MLLFTAYSLFTCCTTPQEPEPEPKTEAVSQIFASHTGLCDSNSFTHQTSADGSSAITLWQDTVVETTIHPSGLGFVSGTGRSLFHDQYYDFSLTGVFNVETWEGHLIKTHAPDHRLPPPYNTESLVKRYALKLGSNEELNVYSFYIQDAQSGTFGAITLQNNRATD